MLAIRFALWLSNKKFPIVFRINWDAPNGVGEFKITYEFYPIDKFPEKRAKNPA